MPYITAVHSSSARRDHVAHPSSALRKEGESGRKKLNQYTRYGTVCSAWCRAISSPVGLRAWGATAVSRR
jgi:preprotein translocase subunit SecY